MGKKSRKKKHLARLRAANKRIVEKPLQTSPSINLEVDSDATAPKTEVASDVRKIALIMISLAAIVVVVAILNAQTDYVNIAGGKIMQWLHIYGS